MARYRNVHVKIWRDPDFQEYPPDGKLVFVYLLTNADLGESGLYAIAPRTINHDTGIRRRRVIELLGGGLKNVVFDEGTSTIFVVKYLTYNPIRNGQDLRIKAIETERATIISPLWEIFDQCYEFSNEFGYIYRGYEAPIKGLHKGINNSTSTSTPTLTPKPTIIREEISVELNKKIESVIVELEKLDSWPQDERFRNNETVVLAELINEYPRVDPLKEARNLRTWLSERPVPKNPNYLTRLRNWFRKAEEFRVGTVKTQATGKRYSGPGTEL